MKMRKFENVEKNKLGYWEIKTKPSEEELQEYYASEYYQQARGSFELEYSQGELDYFDAKIEQRWAVIRDRFPDNGTMLDVGCGEGYALSYFSKVGWKVKGLDFSREGVESKNPHCAEFLVAGDVFDLLQEEQSSGNEYDVLWLQNVLEHVLDPIELMKSLRKLAKPGGVLVLTVPNDFSDLQLHLIENDHIDQDYWIAPPDHLTYFSRDSLLTTGKATGWNCFEVLGDVPIDWFLFHPASNYIRDRSVGKKAHMARVELENLIHKKPVEDVVNFFSALAKIGMGRDLTAFYEAGS